MITSVECREHAAECRQMAEHAPNLRVRTILIDIARTWERLALEVATPSDYGIRGDAPTHPELLDYLAQELIKNGWRLKPSTARHRVQSRSCDRNSCGGSNRVKGA